MGREYGQTSLRWAVVLLAFALNAFLVLWLLDVSFYDYTQRETNAQLPIDTMIKTLDRIKARLFRCEFHIVDMRSAVSLHC